MELKATNHSYYSSDSNFYVGNYKGENYGRCEYDSWKDFEDSWLLNDGTLDDDYNHVFRFDIKNKEDEEGEKVEGFELWLFFVLQRKGIYRPVYIKTITAEDMTKIEKFLRARWEYMQHQWSELA